MCAIFQTLMTTSNVCLASWGLSFLGAMKTTFTNVIYHLKPLLPLSMCFWECSRSAFYSIKIALATPVLSSPLYRLQASPTLRESLPWIPRPSSPLLNHLLLTAPIRHCLMLYLRFKPKAMWASPFGSGLSSPSQVRWQLPWPMCWLQPHGGHQTWTIQ